VNARRSALFAVALAAVVTTLLVIRSLGGERTEEPTSVAPAAQEEVAPAEEPPTTPVSRGTRETVSSASADQEPTEVRQIGAPETAVMEAALEAKGVALTGRVVDVDAQPIVSAAVAWGDARDEVLARSASDGGFRMELDTRDVERRRTLVIVEPGLAHVRTSLVQKANLTAEHLLVVAPAVDVSGTVLDEGGIPLAGARVDLLVTPMAGFPYVLETTRVARWTTATDERGMFQLERAPTHERFELRAAAGGHVEVRKQMPSTSRADLVFFLAAAERETSLALTGVVLHDDGRPAASATVLLGRDRTNADEAGRFSLTLGKDGLQRGPLVAYKVDYQAALLHDVVPTYIDRGLSPPPLELVLGPPALTIQGEVRDAAGAPCLGWVVALLDGEHASVRQAPPILVEDLVREGPRQIVTDEEGQFLLEGLSARDYTVRAYDPERLVQVRSEPVPAGSRVVLRVPEGAFRERLSGRVLARDGAPTARSGPASSWWSGSSVETDALGRFELREVPRHDVFLSVQGEQVISSRHELDADAPDEGNTVEVIRRCRFRVSWAAAQPGDQFALVDHDESMLSIMEIRASSSSSRGVWPLENGESPPLSVSEEAIAILLLREGEEVARHPVRLDSDELTVVRP
jgi:hypothetical protein